MATPKTFTGQLKQSQVLSSLYNMIIGQEVFSDNIKLKGTLVEKFRIDGTLYGDTKLFIATDTGLIRDFPDESGTLLTKRQPKNPDVQAVTIDTFKQTAITIDGVRLKQAFASADIYGAFVAVTVQWLRDSYKVLNVTLLNTFIGTTVTEAAKGVIEVELPAVPSTTIVERQAYHSLTAEIIGQHIADVMIDLEDAMREYNDLGYLRAYDMEDFMIVWNKAYINKIKHISLPKIFHKGDVIGSELESITLNSRFFGKVLGEHTLQYVDGGERTTIDMIVKVDDKGIYDDGGVEKQFFAGDLLPIDTPIYGDEVYFEDPSIICKLVHKRAVPFMSALLIGTEFYNPKDLDKNHYLTWGYSQPTYLRNFPLITFKAVEEEVVEP